MSHPKEESYNKAVDMIFEKFDKDHKGNLNYSQCRSFIVGSDGTNEVLGIRNDFDLYTAIVEMDKSKNGMIEKEELIAWLKKKYEEVQKP